jgi:hypothetical protein
MPGPSDYRDGAPYPAYDRRTGQNARKICLGPSHRGPGGRIQLVTVGAVMALVLAGFNATPVFANAPWWHIASSARPTNLIPGGEGKVIVTATNLGDTEVNASGVPVTFTDKLPAGLSATAISGNAGTLGQASGGGGMECALPSPPNLSLSCAFTGNLQPYELLEVEITVKVAMDARTGEENRVTVSGGETPSASAGGPIMINASPAPFGVERYEFAPENPDGSPATQAGSHPFQVTGTFALNQTADISKPAAIPKDLNFDIPPGLVGNPTPFPQCKEAAFTTDETFGIDLCPSKTAVGVASFTVAIPNEASGALKTPVTLSAPIFNLVPRAGEPARFGFFALDSPIFLDTSVRTGRDYGVTISSDDISETANVIGSQVTLWGVPGDPRHDVSRGWGCVGLGRIVLGCTSPEDSVSAPFLTLPTSCTGPLQTSLEADSWAQPGSVLSFAPSKPGESLDGCNHLGFEPSISVAPDGQAANTPTGLKVRVHVPQEISLNPAGLAESDVKQITVALPAGVQVSPSSGDGLQACSNAQIGFRGVNPQTGTEEFTPELPKPLEPGINFCPEASKVATVKIETPLLPNALEGAVYLAAPQNFMEGPLENPFRSLVAMYLVARDPVSGVLIKFPGKVSLDPVTGQLTTTFEAPQLPFEDAEFHFFGGERAPLSTPALCGTYMTQASFTPWSGNPPVMPSSGFEITSGSHGAPCADPQPFNPGFNAETTNIQAGAFTPFTLTMTRPDADQTLSRIETKMPPGLSGILSNVKLCGEPQAAQGTCGPESLIGETVVSAGLGNDPFTVTGGKVYITTSYKGAPFGLSIVNPATAGPFVLDEGRPIVVRAQIFVDPHTAALRIVSDPLPTILDGIPLQLQHINVSIDREKFTFNPTSCNKMAINGTIGSSEGASATVSAPFQVTDCEKLAFKPKFAASISGKTSKAKGASLTVKLTYPNAPQGSEANIAKVKVDLPKQLPSRLTTLQKACVAAVFEANPANCPAASIVGHAKAITPIIPVPLEGSAYFVSHGGEAFPSLIVVLRGYGVTVDLVGTTFISKAGITSSTFNTVPDVPVGSFELTLPESRYSALAANLPARAKGNFCSSKLAMPTAFVAQNGAEIHESTKIGVTGCPKAKKSQKTKQKKPKSKTKKE